MIPWAILCILGIVGTIPAIFVIGIGAGAAQADRMSDEFIIGLVFVTPTVLAIAIAEFLRWRTDPDTSAYHFLGLGGNHPTTGYPRRVEMITAITTLYPQSKPRCR